MKKSTIGFFLILIVGLAGILIWRYFKPLIFEKKQLLTSDAADSSYTIKIGGDNYLGYWFITSPEMKKLAARKGLQIDFNDDQGAYADRLGKFDRKKYDCIVLPINSYLEHGAQYHYPGVIVASISESKGADGIVGFEKSIPSNKINDINNSNLKIVFTSDSPSSFLMNLTIADFDLDQLQNDRNWQVKVYNASDVLKHAKRGKGDLFILWEPDLSKALKIKGMKYIWGSDKFSGYIVDVMVFHRDFLERHPEAVNMFLSSYFRVLDLYAINQENLIDQMIKSTNLKKQVILDIMKKIEWHNLSENCRLQFGIKSGTDSSYNIREGVINTIIACTDVLIRTGKMKKDPLNGNPYRITHSKILEELSNTQIMSVTEQTKHPVFSKLAKSEWARLIEVGTFRVEPITFQSWNNELADESKEKIKKIANLLINNYPSYRIIIRGHTGPGGNEKENIKLSSRRAKAVSTYLTENFDVNKNRIHTEGVGSSKPALRKNGESERAYQYRLSRVEFIALQMNPF